MGSCQMRSCLVLVLCLSLFISLSTSTFISDGIFGSQVLSERRLLQAKKRELPRTICSITRSCRLKDEEFNSWLDQTNQTAQITVATCPENFEFQNYTIITSRCKGPQYPPNLCCSAFKDFACPFADDLNDLSNDCASTMFSYINLYGKYPPGLFAFECREGKLGLECPAVSPSASMSDTGNANANGRMPELLPMLILLAASLVLLMQLI